MTEQRPDEQDSPGTVADTRTAFETFRRAGERTRRRSAAPSAHEVESRAETARPMGLWNTGIRTLTNRTRQPGEPANAGVNLYYIDLEWSPFAGPGEPLGVIPKEVDERPSTNQFDAGGIILPWCSNSVEVRNKAIEVYQLGPDLNTIGDKLLVMFQYYWDSGGYYLPAGFTSFSQRMNLGEGPSSNLNVEFLFDPPRTLIAQAVAV